MLLRKSADVTGCSHVILFVCVCVCVVGGWGVGVIKQWLICILGDSNNDSAYVLFSRFCDEHNVLTGLGGS